MSHTDQIRSEAHRDAGRGIAAFVTVVACGQVKGDTPAPARDLYRGDLTRKQITAGERTGRYLILSAEHGLVDPDQVLAPYDTTLSDMTRDEQAAWADRVVTQLVDLGHTRWVVSIMAGQAYQAPIRAAAARAGIDVRVCDLYANAPTSMARQLGHAPMIGERKRMWATRRA